MVAWARDGLPLQKVRKCDVVSGCSAFAASADKMETSAGN